MQSRIQLPLLLWLILGGGLMAGQDLAKAVNTGELAAVKQALAAGEKINATDGYGWTPLMWAAYNNHQAIADHLLANGADPNAVAVKGYRKLATGATALIIAAYYGNDAIAWSLVSHGAKIDVVDGSDKKAMDYATEYGFTQVIEALNKDKPQTGTPVTAEPLEFGDNVNARPLAKAYRNILIAPFGASAENAKLYAEVIQECTDRTLNLLKRKTFFTSVSLLDPARKLDATLLLVKTEVVDIRIPGAAARFWVGPLAGRSYAKVRLQLIDAATGNAEREVVLSTEANPWAASLTFGAADRNVPSNLGVLLAEYIALVARGPKPAAE